MNVGNKNGVIMRGLTSNGGLEYSTNSLESELEIMRLQQQGQRNRNLSMERERDLNIIRSGSAPPTVEGSLSAVGSFFRNPKFADSANISSGSGSCNGSGILTEEEIRSHPAYLAYYYSHENSNPRLPLPLLSKEDWRVAQRVQAGGSSVHSVGNPRKNNIVDDGGSSSLFSVQPGLSVQKAEEELMELRKAALRNLSRKSFSEVLDKNSASFAGASGAGMGSRRKSFADILQALEVVDVDQQTQMVRELDGSVMKCVRDQNGNHVIQKCIECVPQERIQFIISSFFGQVVSLSSHPYGCRVIQRVLEHCDDPNTQQAIVDEIMHSVCTLVQDQYGNYVIQHVLQHGKSHERSSIICELAGQIVKMSQQKFASNVIEKCLIFGSPEERQLLVNEMLGSTDENEPLQAMMKDPFGNYVVQKVLETSDDQTRELILSRIKVHLSALKKYTYGKHIVSRVEKLIATGERHIGLSSNSS